MSPRGALTGLLGFLTLVSGCHITIRASDNVRASDNGRASPPGRLSTQEFEERDERMAVLIALGAEMQREQNPGMIVVHGNFLEPEDRPQGPPPTRFQPMRPVDPAIMSYALAAGALVDISPRPGGRWHGAFYDGAGRRRDDPGNAAPPIRIYHHSLDVPVIIGDSAFVDITETVLTPGTGKPAEATDEGWRYILRRQGPDHPWIMVRRVLIRAH